MRIFDALTLQMINYEKEIFIYAISFVSSHFIRIMWRR